MSLLVLEKYLPPGSMPFLKQWFGSYSIHIKITRGRVSKLGDYRKLPNGSHQISINYNLVPELFFFVLTHELAHLISFEENLPKRIAAHGVEWKARFRKMLMESLSVYTPALQTILQKFCHNPKANFMASPELVKYFHSDLSNDDHVFIETLEAGSHFIYRNQIYVFEAKRKINYICKNLVNKKKYIFRPLARVKPQK